MVRSNFDLAWERCLPIWRDNGGADDWRDFLGRPYYTPSFANRLARVFAVKHHNSVDKLLKKASSGDVLLAVSSLDVLGYIGMTYPGTKHPISSSSAILNRSVAISLEDDAQKYDESPLDRLQFVTVGDYFTWNFEINAVDKFAE